MKIYCNYRIFSKKLLLGLLPAALVLSACGDDDDDKVLDPLVGTWNLACTLDEEDDEDDANYMMASIVIAADLGFSVTFGMYEDEDCSASGQLIGLSGAGTLVKGAAVSGIDGAFNVDQVITSSSYTIYSSDFVNYFNDEEICGGEWVKDEVRVIDSDAEKCDAFDLKAGNTLYDIYKIDGTTLKFGDSEGDLDATTAAKRPDTLDESEVYQKQQSGFVIKLVGLDKRLVDFGVGLQIELLH